MRKTQDSIWGTAEESMGRAKLVEALSHCDIMGKSRHKLGGNKADTMDTDVTDAKARGTSSEKGEDPGEGDLLTKATRHMSGAPQSP